MIEEEIEDRIVIDSTFSQYPCAQQIVQSAYGSCTILNELLLDIFEANDKVNLTFSVDQNLNGNASTDPQFYFYPITKTMDVNISFRASYLNNVTDLSITRSTIHESVHAILVYMFEEGKLSTITGQADPDFSELFDAFIEYNRTSFTVNLNKTQHELMNNFINEMATSLSAYGNVAGYNLPFSYYRNLSYSGGILNSQTFKNSYPEYLNNLDAINNPSNRNPEHIKIIYDILSEQNNETEIYNYPDGTSYTATPKGKAINSANSPCY
ncbi:hypothetical protein DSM03_1011224 [Leeuwenhoekiella aestuarii]|uniref:Uncharacterized protein n=1 Tax=Leeuwenhoekiella aestuarii TaxID=2249426 RepID=A0A4Q0NZX2_9FLAO|nr:hypothetical protein [Leeuwenhoekiella aestuarii]RXG18533.1 hypothetical protein DSM04_101735 [Leeuwenhoekiella aestuarii]RXG19838.1 hypothetical protein DSM03_1011224 [Leeuwenhoekiella aestuarii]